MLLVPGFVTSGLELWEGPPCAAGLFRSRVWGQMVREAMVCRQHHNLQPQGMMRTVLTNITCFLELMHLDPTTGMDPPGTQCQVTRGECTTSALLLSRYPPAPHAVAVGD